LILSENAFTGIENGVHITLRNLIFKSWKKTSGLNRRNVA